jgi:uncharacterized protein YdbL (DUF1318 family)
LRQEVIEGEEQRAYIAMLKVQLADKMEKLWTFDSSKQKGKSKPVDGYLALIQTQQLVESLQLENNQLRM